jgi:hypothetical protein
MASTGKTILYVLGGLFGGGVLLFLGLCVVCILLWRTDVVRYRHAPSADLRKGGYDLRAKELDPFRVGDLVTRVSVSDHPVVGMTLFGKQEATATVVKLRLQGKGGKKDVVKEVEVGETIEVKRTIKDHPGVLYGSHTFELGIKREAFAVMAEEGLLMLITIQPVGGEPKTVEFEVERTVTREIVWPT